MIPDITFGVLNYNPNNDRLANLALKECLFSLKDNISKQLKSEVYLIDQADPCHYQQHILRNAANRYNWRTIFLDRNIGISRGINLLANIARGHYICLVTSDVIFTPGLEETLIEILEKQKDIWQICPVSENTAIDAQRMGNSNTEFTTTIAQELTVQIWPRTTFEMVGYFDECWKACYENLDFALRIFIAGGLVAIANGVTCPHKHNTCTKNGARNYSYDGYIDMSGGFDQNILAKMWQEKWPALKLNMYHDMTNIDIHELDKLRQILRNTYPNNIYLSYIQDVNY